AAMKLTGARAANAVDVRVDGGAWRHVVLSGGRARVDLPQLARAGAHTVELDAHDRNAVAVMRATTSVLVPYRAEATPQSPCTLAVEGDIPARDERARTLTLVVRARLPRLVASPHVSVSIPAGMDVD